MLLISGIQTLYGQKGHRNDLDKIIISNPVKHFVFLTNLAWRLFRILTIYGRVSYYYYDNLKVYDYKFLS